MTPNEIVKLARDISLTTPMSVDTLLPSMEYAARILDCDSSRLEKLTRYSITVALVSGSNFDRIMSMTTEVVK